MDRGICRVPSKGLKHKTDAEFQAVVFSRKTKGQTRSSPSEKNSRSVSNTETKEFDIKRATKEIIKLGAAGFYQHRRDVTLKKLAIELGARPEKNKASNYKMLKEARRIRKDKKEQRLNALKESCILSTNKHKTDKNRRSKRNTKDISLLKNYGDGKKSRSSKR